MPKRMSRRAVLRAIGISPVILSLAGVEGRAEAKQQTTKVVDEFWTPALDQDLDKVVEKGKGFYKGHHGHDWNRDEEKKYRNIAKNLYAFYVAGIEFVRKKKGKQVLGPPPGFLVTACDYDGTTTGTSVAMNLGHFHDSQEGLDVETEICAWRCGKAAAEKELQEHPEATVVTADSYAFAWRGVQADVHYLRSQLAKRDPSARSFGGGC